MVFPANARLVAVLSHPEDVVNGLPWACTLARQAGLPLTLLHVIDPLVSEEASVNAWAMAEDMLAMLPHHPTATGLNVETRVEEGMPDAVLGEAFGPDSGLVPMLIAGHYGVFSRRLLGRDDRNVIRAIKVPFLFLPAKVDPAAPITAALLAGATAEQRGRLATTAAGLLGSSVHLVNAHVVEPGMLEDGRFREFAPTFEPDRFSMRGRPHLALLAAARIYETGLIAVGTHADGTSADRHLGSTAEWLAANADRPLLVFPSRVSA